MKYSEDRPAPRAHEAAMACALERTILALVRDPDSSARAVLVSYPCTTGYDLATLALKCRQEADRISLAPEHAHVYLAGKEADNAAYGVARGFYGEVPSVPRVYE